MKKIKKSYYTLLLSSALSLVMIGCGYSNENQNIVGKSELISATPMFDISSQNMQTTVSKLAPGHPAFGIKGYRILYKTHDEKGKEINASALLTIPVPSKLILDNLKKDGKDFTMSIVSDQHGTIFLDKEAPTNSVLLTKKPTQQSVLFSAIGGFITLQPDYIGYGASKDHIHPYLLQKSSANSVIDLIKSSIKFANDKQLPINGQIFLTGYSEGGYVTLAAQKEIEKNHPNLHLKGSIPMSGPYDLNITGMGILSQDQILRPDFVSGIIYSYAKAYDLKLDQILNPQYASKLPTLFDKTKDGSQIQAELSHTTNDLINPNYRMDFLTNPKNPLRVEFINNSVDNFKPKTPTLLYYCGGDKTIPPKISLKASKALGVDAIDIDPTLNHIECAQKAYPAALKYFSDLRSK